MNKISDLRLLTSDFTQKKLFFLRCMNKIEKRGNTLYKKGGKEMFQIFLKNKKFLMVLSAILILLSLIFSASSLGMQHYEKLDFVTGLVTASALNVRSGPRNKLQGNNTSLQK